MQALSLNIQCGKFLTKLKDYLLKKVNYDFILLQEVAGGYRYDLQYQKKEFNKSQFDKTDCFREIANILDKKFKGYLAKSYNDTTGENYLGNAIFINTRWKNIKYKEILLGGNTRIEINETSHSSVGYTLQAVQVADAELSVLNTHIIKYDLDNYLAEKYLHKIRNFIDKEKSFVLGGDFNIDYNTHLFSKTYGHHKIMNKTYHIKNTLNRQIHPLFRNNKTSKGLSVDNFITSQNIYPIRITVEYNTVSDHYPVIFEFKNEQLHRR